LARLAGPPPASERRPRLRAGWLLIAAGATFTVLMGVSLSIHHRNDRYLLDATAPIFDGPGSDESKAIALAHFVAVAGAHTVNTASASALAMLEHSLPLELSPVTVLKEGFAFPNARRFGPCGQLARTIRSVAWLRHIRSHKVVFETDGHEHVMVTLRVDGADRLFDPTYDFHWVGRDGHIASIEEVERDPAVFAQIYQKVPNYPYRLEGVSYFRWSRLGPPGLWLRNALAAVMGRAWVDQVDTPLIYERPWLGYALACGCAAAFFFALGILSLRPAQPSVRTSRARTAPARAIAGSTVSDRAI